MFFGDASTIAEKMSIEADRIIGKRRLFYISTGGDSPTRIDEYEHKQDNTYTVRVASVDQNTTQAFLSEVQKTVLENRGNSCVGKAVQNMPLYKSLHFEIAGEKKLDEASSLAPENSGVEHKLHGGQSTEFHQVGIFVLC